MADILPRDLPAGTTVNPASAVIFDDGNIVQKATPQQIVDSARPLASQADAETATDNVKIMSPLRVGQAISKNATLRSATDAAPVGYEPGIGTFDQDGKLRRIPARAARGWIDPREMTAWVSETTDHTASFQAALTASRDFGVPVSAGGDLILTFAGASLDPTGATIRGMQQAFTRNSSDPTSGGLVLRHNSANPLFQPTAGAFEIEGITYYDMQQPGTGAAPVVRPPFMRVMPGVQITDVTIENTAIVNAYDMLEIMPSAGALPAGLIGDWRINNNRIFSVRHDFNIKGHVPEVVFVADNVFSPGVDQGQAIFSAGGMLSLWKAKNGSHLRVDTGANRVEGWSSKNNYIFDAWHGINVVSGGMTVSTFNGDHFDQVANILQTSGASLAELTMVGGIALPLTYGDAASITDAITLGGSGIHRVTIQMQVGQTRGAWINAAATLPAGSSANRIVDRSTVLNTGGSVTILNNAPGSVLLTEGSYDKFAQRVCDPMSAPFGAVGNGTTDDRAALFLADAAGPVDITANHRVSSDITFNGLVTFRGRGRLTIDAGVTVTFKRQPVAPWRQIFYGTGAVAGLPTSRLEWFVGDADAPAPTVECGAGVRRWLNSTINDGALASMPMRLLVDGTNPYDVSKGQSFIGPGQWQLFFCWQNAACNGFRFTAGSVDGATFSGFQWRMNTPGMIPTSGTAIDVQSSYITLSDFFINDCYNGLNLGQSVVTYVQNFQIIGSVNSGFRTNDNTLDYHVRAGIVQALYDWVTISGITGTFNAGDNFTLNSGQTGTIQEKYDATHYRVRFVGPMPATGATMTKSGASATIAAIQVGHQQGGIVLLDSAEAVTMQSMDVLGGRKGLVTFTSGGLPRDGFSFSRVNDVYFDSSYEGSNMVNAYGVVFSGGWFASSANSGAKGLVLNGCRRIVMTAPQFVNNADSGLSILSNCQDIEVHAIACDGNNTLGGLAEVYVQGGASNVRFIGGKAGYSGANGVTPPKSFYIDTGVSNKLCLNCVDVPSGSVTNLNTATEQTLIGISGIAFRNL